MSAPRLTLHRLAFGYRLLYSAVLVFFVLGHGAGLVQQQLRAGLSPRGVTQWVRGNEDDLDATRFLFVRDARELLDDVWRRSLADVLPTVVVLSLLFRSGAPAGLRGPLSAVLTGTALADIAGPAITAWLGTAGGWLWWGAQILLAGGMAASALVCIVEMWVWRRRGARFEPAKEALG